MPVFARHHGHMITRVMNTFEVNQDNQARDIIDQNNITATAQNEDRIGSISGKGKCFLKLLQGINNTEMLRSYIQIECIALSQGHLFADFQAQWLTTF